MSSVQRRRGRPITFWQVRQVEDARGNRKMIADPDTKITVRTVAIPQRSSRAELVGQIEIDVTRVIVDANLPDVSLWSLAEFDGHMWDVQTPPELHYGTRQVRHWSIDLRKRPDENDG